MNDHFLIWQASDTESEDILFTEIKDDIVQEQPVLTFDQICAQMGNIVNI